MKNFQLLSFLAISILLVLQLSLSQAQQVQFEQRVPPQLGYFSLQNKTVMIGANLLYQSGTISPKEFNDNTTVAHSIFTKTFDFPLADQFSQQKLQQFVAQSLIEGAYPMITFVLAEGDNFTTMDITTLTNDISWVADVIREFSNYTIFINFFPDANGNWYGWGQNPFKFIAAYQLFSTAIKGSFPNVQMVQTFTQDSGYPIFGGTVSPFLNDTTVGTYLDSNFDGVVNGLDDPYSPYWAGGPNDTLVDFIGFEYSFTGIDQRNGTEFLDIIPAANQWDTGFRRFYQLVASNHRKPVIVTLTSSFWSPKPNGGTANDTAIKSAWINQVYNQTKLQGKYPKVKALMWQEDYKNGTAMIEDYCLTNKTALLKYYSKAVSNDTFYQRGRKFVISSQLKAYANQQVLIYKASDAPKIIQSSIIYLALFFICMTLFNLL